MEATPFGRTVFLCLILFLTTLSGEFPLSGEETAPPDLESKAEIPLGPDGKPLPLSLKQVIRLVLDHNSDVRLQQMEILKSDTAVLKAQSPFTPKASFGLTTYEKTDKPDRAMPSSLYAPLKTKSDTISTGISKLYETGTFVQLELSNSRSEIVPSAESALLYGLSGSYTSMIPVPALHTGALTLVLQQELVKNAFGYTLQRANAMARNGSKIQRQALILQLNGLVVKAMVDYWSVAIAEENAKTAEILLNNTENLRSITIRKVRIGLAESFEVNQWNALVSQAEARLDQAYLSRNQVRRGLLRVMNLDPQLELTGQTELLEELPDDLNFKQDLEGAYASRPDLKNIALLKENAQLQFEISENNLEPSVTIGGSIASRDFGKGIGPYGNVASFKYPEYALEFKVEYPFGDPGAEAEMRNARIDLKKASIQEGQLRRQIEDEIRDGIDQILTGQQGLVKTKQAFQQTEAYYNGLLQRYRQGRFNAAAVKSALDALVQARGAVTQSKINFNIALIRYDLARNVIWKKYGVDIDDVIDRLAEGDGPS